MGGGGACAAGVLVADLRMCLALCPAGGLTTYLVRVLPSAFACARYYGTQWPGVGGQPSLVIPSDTVILHFRASSTAPEWGWRAVFTADAPFLARQTSADTGAAAVGAGPSAGGGDGDADATPARAEVVVPPVVDWGLTDDDHAAAAKIFRELKLSGPTMKNGGAKIGALRKLMKTAAPRVNGRWRQTLKYDRPKTAQRVHEKAHTFIQATTSEEDLFLTKSFSLLYDILRGTVRMKVSCDDNYRVDTAGRPLPDEPTPAAGDESKTDAGAGDESKTAGGDESKTGGGDESKAGGEGGGQIDADAAIAAQLAREAQLEADARMAAQLAGVPYKPQDDAATSGGGGGGGSGSNDGDDAPDVDGPLHWTLGKLFAEMLLLHAQAQKKQKPLGDPSTWGYMFLMALAHTAEQDAGNGLITHGEPLGRVAEWPVLPYTGSEGVRDACRVVRVSELSAWVGSRVCYVQSCLCAVC